MTGAKSGQTRDRILFAAAEVLSNKGYSATRLSEIAATADLRAPAVYYYFASRHELIAEVMTVGQARLREHVVSALDCLPADTDPLGRLCAAAAAHLEVELELSHFATAVTRNTGQLPDDIRARLRDDSRAYSRLWNRLIEDAYQAGQVRDDLNRRAAVKLVMSALNGAPEWWDRSQGPLSDLMSTAESLIRHGLGRIPPSTNPLPDTHAPEAGELTKEPIT